MKFGKLSDIADVNFLLPPDAVENAVLYEKLPHLQQTKLYIGCTGWSMKEWKGKIYPAKAKPNEFLSYYGKQFNTIELNTTHYRVPTPDTVDKWYSQTPADFRFCPKIPQTISHRNDLGVNGGVLPLFCENIRGLKDKLGCCFMQLPPYFSIQYLPSLERFFDVFPMDIPLAIEFRHESWFSNPDSIEIVAPLLEKYQKSTCITDVAGRRDVLHSRLTNNIAMVRFVGNDLHDTDFERLDEWIDRLVCWAEQGIKEIYFFPHQPDNINAPEAVIYVNNAIKEYETLIARGPKLIKVQLNLF